MTQPRERFLKDYQPLSFSVAQVDLTFDLAPEATRVTNVMQMTAVATDQPVVLDGAALTLKHLAIDGQPLAADAYRVTDDQLSFWPPSDAFELSIETQIAPQANTALEGLYLSGGNYCTQCEAEGFRRITYFPDRPDLLTTYTTRVIGPEAECPVLLSNGDLIEQGTLSDGRHYAVWHDPHRKPSYLFALVAGDLACVQDHFTTAEGREVQLDLYVEAANIDQCDHAMASLKKAMAWDEQRFGLSYDLDTYMIVAVEDFNMGAMENKGLNVFNAKFVLAKPETATDADYEGIESVIAHEYFHNWTGNRITCRDWFQLTLKEGLTVFRDQLFTADSLSAAVKRIEDVKRLRAHQFVEDAGPMAHPIQPQSYIEMNNFYTLTVYEKGAEVVRLYHTLLGESGFQKGMQRYIQQWDGQAVTVEDFRAAMSEANARDLSGLHPWYVQPGTPHVTVTQTYDPDQATLQLHFEQTNPKMPDGFAPYLIPMGVALWSQQGDPLDWQVASADQKAVVTTEKGRVILLDQLQQTLTLTQVSAAPIVSLLRDFSAPIVLESSLTLSDRSVLARCETDPFARWEAMQTLAMQAIFSALDQVKQGAQTLRLLPAYEQAVAEVLASEQLDAGLKALALQLPDLDYVAEQLTPIPVEALHQAYLGVEAQLATTFESQWMQLYQTLQTPGPYCYDASDIAQRKLKQTCLHYLAYLSKGVALAEALYQTADNMTEMLAALKALNHHPARAHWTQDFYERWRHDALVLDKWFALQATTRVPDPIAQIESLLAHPDFHAHTPNRVRSVLGAFARGHFMGFHQADGQGYRLLGAQIQKLDAINPQMAARLCAPLTQWRRFEPQRQTHMKAVLESIAQTPDLSNDVYEIVTKSLAESASV